MSKALLSWIVTQGIGTALIEPGKPWQNGVAGANGKFRDECLSLEWFRSRAEAKVLIEEWRRPSTRYVFQPRLSRAERVRGSRNKASAPPCNGPGRYGIWGLRAPARCSTVPAGTNAASKGGRLKLTVVRRTWAGHIDALIREGDKFDYPKWLQRVREGEAQAKQGPTTFIPRVWSQRK